MKQTNGLERAGGILLQIQKKSDSMMITYGC